MTVSTVKMSDFAVANPNTQTNEIVGISSPSGGINIRQPAILTWTTLTRPTMPYDGLMGYNTTLDYWEYFQASSSSWVQFTINTNSLMWLVITAASTNGLVGTGYIANRSSTVAQIILPPTFNIGNTIQVMGLGTAGWSLVANVGQTIKFGSVTTITEGSVSSSIQYSNVEVRGLVADTTWTVWSTNDNLIYV